MTQALPFLARRALLALAFSLAFSLALTPALAADSGPAVPVTAIYKRVVESFDGKQNNSENGYFIWKDDKTRRQYFSARTAKLWREADRLTPKGDESPPGFDPVTNSQDPLVRAFDTSIERQDAKSATVVVRISEMPGPITQPAPREFIRYDMVLQRGRWVIDDIRGTVDTEWSVRKIMADYIAMCTRPETAKFCR